VERGETVGSRASSTALNRAERPDAVRASRVGPDLDHAESRHAQPVADGCEAGVVIHLTLEDAFVDASFTDSYVLGNELTGACA
jgi:hypothetical protein